jgi:LruC domain-containing protein
MKKILNFSAFAVVILIMAFFTSCKKEVNNPAEYVDSMEKLVVPEGFNWKTTTDIDVTINISGAKDYQAKSKVSVFNADPANGGKMMVSGNSAPGSSFTSKMRIPAYLTQVFIKMESPFGGGETVAVPISGNALEYTFDTQKSGGEFKSTDADPVCGAAGDIVLSPSNGGSVTITGGLSYSLSVSVTNLTINFTNSGGTLKICGTVTAGNINMNKATHHLKITQGGSLTTSDLGFNASGTITVYSNSTLTVNNNFSSGGNLTNYGTINMTGSYVNSNGAFENYGSFNVGNDMSLNSQTTNKNGCKIIVAGSFAQNSPSCMFHMLAGSYLQAAGSIDLTKQNTYFYDGAMMKGNSYSSNSQSHIYASGGTSLIVVQNTVDINGTMDGPITVVYNPGSTVNVGSGLLTNGAQVVLISNVTTYIPISACNPVGFGEPPIVDTDLDGVPDDTDLYPTDPLRASNSYFPAEGVWGTIAFEDLWPAKGDYDFNDLILDYTGYMILNAQNNIKDVKIDFRVRAVGASLNNGFGFQLDQITPDQVESVTGMVHESSDMDIVLNANGTEAGQAKAVIVPVESVENVINRLTTGSMFNTVVGGGSGTWDVVTTTVTFVDAIAPGLLGPEDFNPFLIVNQDRGVEVHLPDMVPTDLVNPAFFGTLDDDSNPTSNRYYKTVNNLPWAINIYEQFDYPIEKIEVVNTYYHFAEWAQSGGSVYNDWYKDLPGYRNEVNIY